MKKLNKVLFGFGTVAAVVAPVVSVVACGDEEPSKENIKFTDKASITAFAKEKGYSVTEDQATKILAVIGARAEVLEVLPGKLSDTNDSTKTHGNDDFAVIIKGTTAQTKLTESLAELTAKPELVEYSNFTVGGYPDTSSLGARWGLTEEKVKDATAILYFQNDGTTFTIEATEVVKTKDNKVLTHDSYKVKKDKYQEYDGHYPHWTVAKATK